MLLPTQGKMSRKLQLVILAVSLAFAGSAHAQFFTGSFAAVDDADVPVSSFTSSSLNLDQLNLITRAETGTFLSLVPAKSDLTAYTGTISGLSTTPAAESISDFFVFSTPDADEATL